MTWFYITHKGGIAHASIFAELGGFGLTAEDFILELRDAAKVELRIDSGGGNADCGLKLRAAFLKLNVVATITGKCQSAALVAAMGAKIIRCESQARLLIHPATTSAIGSAAMLRSAADRLAMIDDDCDRLTARRIGQPLATVRRWSSKQTYFTAAEALAVGLVDEVFTAPVLPVTVTSSNPASDTIREATATETEEMFLAWLAAFGRVPVRDPEDFMRRLALWANQNVSAA